MHIDPDRILSELIRKVLGLFVQQGKCVNLAVSKKVVQLELFKKGAIS